MNVWCNGFLVVAGVVLLGLQPRESILGVLYYRKPKLAALALSFLFPNPYKSKLLTFGK